MNTFVFDTHVIDICLINSKAEEYLINNVNIGWDYVLTAQLLLMTLSCKINALYLFYRQMITPLHNGKK